MTIEYSVQFKRVVKEVIPDNQELHKALEDGSNLVGTILFNNAQKFENLVSLWAKEIGKHLQDHGNLD